VNRGGAEYRASQVVPIGARRETIQRSKLKKRREKKERKRTGKGREKRYGVSMLSKVKWDGVVQALRAGTGVAKPSFNQSQTVSSWHRAHPG
jgi:hypothetical protein